VFLWFRWFLGFLDRVGLSFGASLVPGRSPRSFLRWLRSVANVFIRGFASAVGGG
jgi:hypothetical protein